MAHGSVLACLLACLPACLLACLLACLPACLFACLPACLSITWLGGWLMVGPCEAACTTWLLNCIIRPLMAAFELLLLLKTSLHTLCMCAARQCCILVNSSRADTSQLHTHTGGFAAHIICLLQLQAGCQIHAALFSGLLMAVVDRCLRTTCCRMQTTFWVMLTVSTHMPLTSAMMHACIHSFIHSFIHLILRSWGQP